ncbi:hypothetical protein [Nitrospirillum pindoramense]|uniref:Uncharacterized protein n=1 Tax=Nitrospirillum amazonense TaxID=28077 RepID=A0A560HD40_9PROT|nr:hypothetical protein [Nitrospirillum amazonense]TWB44296.1 hypothetical protein FBZ90_103203 [Nitrospirillum amazonense]
MFAPLETPSHPDEAAAVAEARAALALSHMDLGHADVGHADLGRAPPALTPIAADALPNAVRPRLDHIDGMTAALARHAGCPVSVNVQARVRDQGPGLDRLRRRVILAKQTDGSPLALGLLAVDLLALPPAVAAEALAERTPFGTLLANAGLPFLSRPRLFFRLVADAPLARLLGGHEGETLYGRLAHLALTAPGAEHPVARVVEILRAM